MLTILRSIEGANRWTKLGIVLAGYLLALAAGVVATIIYDLRFSAADQQASGGMIAFGEVMFGAGVFAFLSLAPTALALWSVRRHRGTWGVFTVVCLGFAVAGVVATLALMNATLETVHTPAIALLSVFGVAQMLGSPIWIGSFALFAWLAPDPGLRRRMLVAAAIEVVIGACAVVHFGRSLLT